jgi:mono/diheme cytochrome c family protein
LLGKLAWRFTMPINKYTVLTGVLLLTLGGASMVAQNGVVPQKKKLRTVPVSYVQPTKGPEMYKQYCASCHGLEGRGDGPAVEFLKTTPPDLRTLAQRNGGKYPATRVAGTLRFGTGSHAHGTVDMPLWGPLFRSQDNTKSNVADLRVYNLNEYVQTLQQR